MHIQRSQLAMQSSHLLQQRNERQESLLAWVGQRPATPQETPTISSAARHLWLASAVQPSVPQKIVRHAPEDSAALDTSATRALEDEETGEHDPKLALVRRMVEMLTGQKVKVFDAQAFQADQQSVTHDVAALSQAKEGRGADQGNPENQPAGYGIEYDFHAVHEEHEQSDFSVSGQVLTADGQSFEFSLDVHMSRYFREETTISYREGDAIRKDPLVINFGGTAAQLASAANQSFHFDLDSDGKDETLPTFASASGYLAIDLNGSGTVDDAKELFGPETGNGFAELARLDEDGNGWIDEGDGAFSKLQVWMPAEETAPGASSGTLRSLADFNIGALSLAHARTPFALRGENNQDLGLVRDTGIYLTNSGKVGSVQEIDVTV